MFDRLRKVWQGIKYTRLSGQAFESAASGGIEIALNTLSTAQQLKSLEPMELLLRALLLSRKGSFAPAYENILDAINALESADHIPKPQKNYMSLYASQLGASLEAELGLPETKMPTIAVNYPEVQNAPEFLKNYLPLIQQS